MLKDRKVLLTLLAVAMLALPAAAQDEAYNGYSPYSMFGVGDLARQGSAYNKSMGGIGVATRDKRNINFLNPAAVTEREEKSFMADFGLSSGNRLFAQGDLRSANNTFNLFDFAVSTPIYKSLAVYAGVSPYSDLGYTVTSKITDPAVIGHTGNITTSAMGYGDLTGIFFGAGLKPFKRMSVGAEVTYIFGNLHKNYTQQFSKEAYSSVFSGYNMHLKSFAPKVGLQYDIPVSSEVTATIGATYRFSAGLRGTVRDFEYNVVGSVTDTTRIIIDTLGRGGSNVRLGDELGVGIALRGGDRWTAELDYLRSDWTSCGMDRPGFANVGKAVFSPTASQSVRAGFSFVPNRNDIRYYFRRATYRCGAYWDQSYFKLDGNAVNAFGLTFGVTLPVNRWHNGITLGVDAGQRGSLQGSRVRERYINFNLGLNVFDIWFLKPRYD